MAPDTILYLKFHSQAYRPINSICFTVLNGNCEVNGNINIIKHALVDVILAPPDPRHMVIYCMIVYECFISGEYK